MGSLLGNNHFTNSFDDSILNGEFSMLRNNNNNHNNNENGSKGNLFDGLNGIIGIGNSIGSGSGGGGEYDGSSGITMRSNPVFGQSSLSSHLLSSDISSQQRQRSHSFSTHENTMPTQSTSTSGNSSSANHSIYEDRSNNSGRPTSSSSSIFNNGSLPLSGGVSGAGIGRIGLTTSSASSNSSLATALAAAGDSIYDKSL